MITCKKTTESWNLLNYDTKTEFSPTTYQDYDFLLLFFSELAYLKNISLKNTHKNCIIIYIYYY